MTINEAKKMVNHDLYLRPQMAAMSLFKLDSEEVTAILMKLLMGEVPELLTQVLALCGRVLLP